MKLLNAEVWNFGSYSRLNFDFTDLSLSLVHGATGSGKSTLEDIPFWILFGQTSKDGNVDEVRSWQAGDGCTKGVLQVALPNGKITVARTRGKPAQNDLFWTEDETPSDQHRGKDVTDTQKLLEQRLGCTASLYSIAAFFGEFSSSGSFFTARSKDRRGVFEQISSLDLPKALSEKTSEKKKQVKKQIQEKETKQSNFEARYAQSLSTFNNLNKDSDLWEKRKVQYIEELRVRSEGFETEKESRIEALRTKADRFEANRRSKEQSIVDSLSKLEELITPTEELNALIETTKNHINTLNLDTCPTCGGASSSEEKDKYVEKLHKLEERAIKNREKLRNFNTYTKDLTNLQREENPYISQVKEAWELKNYHIETLAAEKTKDNPYIKQIDILETELCNLSELITLASLDKKELENQFQMLSVLYDLSFDLRAALLQKAVSEVEAQTNKTLEKYFDAQLRVGFQLTGDDDLDISIYKNGNDCVYKQLSKGQRQMLRLSFATSIMKVSANNSGIHFDTLCFDEALDGMDAQLKLQSYGLFEELSLNHSTVLVVDHDKDFQNMFDNKFHVALEGDNSYIEHE